MAEEGAAFCNNFRGRITKLGRLRSRKNNFRRCTDHQSVHHIRLARRQTQWPQSHWQVETDAEEGFVCAGAATEVAEEGAALCNNFRGRTITLGRLRSRKNNFRRCMDHQSVHHVCLARRQTQWPQSHLQPPSHNKLGVMQGQQMSQ